MEMETLLELDERRRTSMGKIGRPEHRRYIVTEEPDGTLILSPAVVMAEHEARLLANQALMAQIGQNLTRPEQLIRRKPRKSAG